MQRLWKNTTEVTSTSSEKNTDIQLFGADLIGIYAFLTAFRAVLLSVIKQHETPKHMLLKVTTKLAYVHSYLSSPVKKPSTQF